MNNLTVPAREGRAFRIEQGQSMRIATPHGAQAADFFAFNASNVGEWLSASHTWVASRATRPRQGNVFLSRFRRPMMDFIEDGADGVHDMMLPACDKLRYEQLGHQGPHASCSENLQIAMRRLGYEISVIPQPVNFFTNTHVEADGTLTSPPNPVKAGAHVTLKAHMDLLCVVSSCPFDLDLSDWTINAPGGPTELIVALS